MSIPAFGTNRPIPQVQIQGDLAWEPSGLNSNSHAWEFCWPQHSVSQLLNKQVLTGVSSPRHGLDKMDQRARASDDPSKDSKLHSHLSHPFSLCVSPIRLWPRTQQPQGQVPLLDFNGITEWRKVTREPPSFSFSLPSRCDCSGLWLPCLVYKVT